MNIFAGFRWRCEVPGAFCLAVNTPCPRANLSLAPRPSPHLYRQAKLMNPFYIHANDRTALMDLIGERYRFTKIWIRDKGLVT